MSIRVNDLVHIYQAGTPLATEALRGVTLEIQEGEFFGLIGQTGSGKSTLIQHLNGLLKPTRGSVEVDGQNLWERGTNLKAIRQKVGLVFQYPEHQLFEETVFADVAFGPRNMGLPEEEVKERVEEALAMVGLDGEIADRSPFELSGGQKRRVAIAGVLAMRPKYLILDEPTAGLDPMGRQEILGEISALQQQGVTVVLVSHNMEEVARLVSRLAVMHDGRLIAQGTPAEVFSKGELLEEVGLALPQIAQLMHRLRERGLDIPVDIYTVEEAREAILRVLGPKQGKTARFLTL
ncbi:MAG: energy-coupling factor transporter ATPase [Firmicutes bacterium]|jgi:energy-coupling factor transport system ATP-binding protein|nr:energy-coupling factor transporter ATPase [Bacillota bacterium]